MTLLKVLEALTFLGPKICSKSSEKTGIFEEIDFAYDPANDVYVCPAGNVMKRRRHKKKRKAYEYALGGKVCNACELKDRCTRSKHGRSVKRHQDHELVEAARAESKSRAAKRDRGRRKHLAEGTFADAANNHGFKRARWRRLWRQRIQDLLIAACQNVRIMLARGKLGPTAQGQKLSPAPQTSTPTYSFVNLRFLFW